MPLEQGFENRDGERVGWYRWGETGEKFYFMPGSEQLRRAAEALARQQRPTAQANVVTSQ